MQAPTLRPRHRMLVSTVTLGVTVTLLMLALRGLPVFMRGELAAYDWQLQMRAARPTPPDIVLAELDRTATDVLGHGRYPVPRRSIARAVDFLRHAHVRAI